MLPSEVAGSSVEAEYTVVILSVIVTWLVKVDSNVVVEACSVTAEVPVFLVEIDRLFSGTKPSVLVLPVDADSVLPGADSEGFSVKA